jgi:hypothetical protein
VRRENIVLGVLNDVIIGLNFRMLFFNFVGLCPWFAKKKNPTLLWTVQFPKCDDQENSVSSEAYNELFYFYNM